MDECTDVLWDRAKRISRRSCSCRDVVLVIDECTDVLWYQANQANFTETFVTLPRLPIGTKQSILVDVLVIDECTGCCTCGDVLVVAETYL